MFAAVSGLMIPLFASALNSTTMLSSQHPITCAQTTPICVRVSPLHQSQPAPPPAQIQTPHFTFLFTVVPTRIAFQSLTDCATFPTSTPAKLTSTEQV